MAVDDVELPDYPTLVPGSSARCRWCKWPMQPERSHDGSYSGSSWCPVQKDYIRDFDVCRMFEPHDAVDMSRVGANGGYHRSSR